MKNKNCKCNRLFLFLPALLVTVNVARADPPNATNGIPNSASSAIRQIARDIETLRPRFAELADFSAATNSVTQIDYRHNADYVAKGQKQNSYYNVKPGGCLIRVEAWDTASKGWPSMRMGPEIASIDRSLTNGIRIMATIETPNQELRKAVRAVVDARLKTSK